MKHLLLSFAFLLLLVGQATSQAKTTLVKSLPTNESSTSINLPGEVVSSEWDKNHIRVTINIQASNTSDQILKRLVSLGRYELKSVETDGALEISMPKIAHLVTIKGVDLEEIFSFEVQLPKGMKINITAPEMLSTSTL